MFGKILHAIRHNDWTDQTPKTIILKLKILTLLNPLSPKIEIQILQTDLQTFL